MYCLKRNESELFEFVLDPEPLNNTYEATAYIHTKQMLNYETITLHVINWTVTVSTMYEKNVQQFLNQFILEGYKESGYAKRICPFSSSSSLNSTLFFFSSFYSSFFIPLQDSILPFSNTFDFHTHFIRFSSFILTKCLLNNNECEFEDINLT